MTLGGVISYDTGQWCNQLEIKGFFCYPSMILGTVHEAHGTRPATALASGSAPRPVDPRGRIRDLFSRVLSTPDAFGGLRRSRAALALVLQHQQNRARWDLLKGKECEGRPCPTREGQIGRGGARTHTHTVVGLIEGKLA